MRRSLATAVSFLLFLLVPACSGSDDPLDPELWSRPGEEWARLLTDPDPEVGAAAVEELISFDEEEFGPQVLWLLHHEDPAVRLKVCRVRLLHSDHAGTVPGLLHALEDDLPTIRAAAAWTIGTTGESSEAVLAALEATLNDNVGQVRVAAAGSLLRLAEKPDPRYLSILLAALRDEDARLRRAAAEALSAPTWWMPSNHPASEEMQAVREEARAVLQQSVGDPDPEVRLAVAVSIYAFLRAEARDLGRTRASADDYVPIDEDGSKLDGLLVGVLEAGGSETRREAAYALAMGGGSLKFLIRFLSDEDPLVREATLSGICDRCYWRTGPPHEWLGAEENGGTPVELGGVLRGLALEDESERVRACASAALGMVHPQSLRWVKKVLLPLAESESPANRALLAVACGAFANHLRAIGVARSHTEEDVRSAQREISGILRRLLDDAHATVRMRACQALSRFGVGSRFVDRARLEELRDSDEAHRVRVSAEAALRILDGKLPPRK